ncbi:MAG: hypothetical protein J0H69_08560 [Burkholderiales bacterium]|nr:hypothetical protein [Burkholderiales bacterium]
MDTPIETHGTVPSLRGLTCGGLFSQGAILGNVLIQDHILFIKASDVWHRLVIDNGVVFWRQQTVEPASWSIPEEGFHYPVRDVGSARGLLGLQFELLTQTRERSTTSVAFRFTNGRCIRFSECDDKTTLQIV